MKTLKQGGSDVVIDEDDSFGSLQYEFLYKYEGIEHLTIEKDSQFLFERSVIKSVEYLIDFFGRQKSA